jgi:predicted  nucleic acid-binding Zn-ribbon protein
MKQACVDVIMPTYNRLASLRKTIDSYIDSGADVSNELHSILGTEVRSLPPALEEYYAHYFKDRSKVVDFAETYQAEFTKRQDQVAAYDAELTKMKPQIEESTNNLSKQSSQISQQYTSLVELRNQGNVAAYNTAVPAYNQRVSQYNKEVNRVQDMIEQYNTVVSKRNDIATEENELSKAIDSRPEEITAPQ